MRRRNFRDARCLVTGASMGLGRALVERLARDGARVLVTARSANLLHDLARRLDAEGVPASAIVVEPADLTRDDDRRRLFDAADRAFGGLDLAVNNAGVGLYGRFESHDPELLRRIMEVNFFAAAEVCRLALPRLRRGDRPSLVNVGSIVARRGLPGRSEYSASKHALAGLTDSLRAEWAIDDIHVLLANPGFTTTQFEKNLLADTAFVKSEHRRKATPEAVAERILRAAARGKNEVTFSAGGRTLLLANRMIPRLVNWGFARWTRKLYAANLPAKIVGPGDGG